MESKLSLILVEFHNKVDKLEDSFLLRLILATFAAFLPVFFNGFTCIDPYIIYSNLVLFAVIITVDYITVEKQINKLYQQLGLDMLEVYK